MARSRWTLGTGTSAVVAGGLLLLLSGAGLARSLATRIDQVATLRTDTSFAATIVRLSEAPGYFDSDNLISNETSYLHAVTHLRAAGVTGGAYVGVGPDQSFSYIAAIRPRVAFMIDIRRDNLLMHLMFKALFQRSSNRLEYLARWTGRPVPPDAGAWTGRSIESILARLDSIPPDRTVAGAESDAIIATVLGFGVPLSPSDTATIRRFHQEFSRDGLELQFTSTGRQPRYYYPTLRDLILSRDLDGRLANYLADESSWRFLKELQARDGVIPIVGNLAGDHALASIGRDVAARNEVVSALYVSNVEMYIWRDGTFPRFAATAARLPRNSRSVIIRSVFGGIGQSHPLRRPNHVSTQLVQDLDDFAAREAVGWTSYWDLITSGNR